MSLYPPISCLFNSGSEFQISTILWPFKKNYPLKSPLKVLPLILNLCPFLFDIPLPIPHTGLDCQRIWVQADKYLTIIGLSDSTSEALCIIFELYLKEDIVMVWHSLETGHSAYQVHDNYQAPIYAATCVISSAQVTSLFLHCCNHGVT